jgi:anoctamin-10/anoctamin-7
MEWGTTEFEEEERERASFYGEKLNSCVNGEKMLYFSDQSRKKLFLYSNAVISGMIMIVIACVAIIFYIQFYASTQVDDDEKKTYINSGASVCLAVQIQILNVYYGNLAESLTERENHR